MNSLFLHEWRTAIREHRWAASLPGALALLTVLVWQIRWTQTLGHPGSDGIGARNQDWISLDSFLAPLLALCPYFILKTPDFNDPFAEWRTRPAGKHLVFGTRLLLAFCATVILPAVPVAFGCLLWMPDAAAASTGQVLWNQSVYFALGFFAAFACKGHRGLALLATLAVIRLITDTLGGVIGEAWLRRQPDQSAYNDSGFAWVYITLAYDRVIPAVVLVWGLIRYRTPGARTRFLPWILLTLLTGGAIGALARLDATAPPRMPSVRLPLIRAEMKADAGGDHDSAASSLGFIRLTPPEENLRLVQWRTPACVRGADDTAVVTGAWATETERGRIRPQYETDRPALQAVSRPENPAPGFDSRWARPFGAALGVPGLKIHGLIDDRNGEPRRASAAIADTDFPKPGPIDLTFFSAAQHPGIRRENFSGKTVTIHAEMLMQRLHPPRTLLRGPLTVEHRMTREDVEETVYPWDGESPYVLARRCARRGPIPLATDFFRMPGIYTEGVYVLVNPSYREAFLLRTERERIEVVSIKLFVTSKRLWLPDLTRLPADWMRGAEIVLLSDEADESVRLPLELTLKVPGKTPIVTP